MERSTLSYDWLDTRLRFFKKSDHNTNLEMDQYNGPISLHTGLENRKCPGDRL